MAGAYEVMRFLEIVLAGLQVATLHDHEFFQDAERPTKRCRDYWSARRRHTCCPLSPERKIRHFRLKGSFGQNTSFLVAEKGPRPVEQLGHIVARLNRSREDAQSKTIETRSYSPYL
jgi:hypothetical protein